MPAGVALTVVTGSLNMNVPGKVYDALDIRGCVSIGASNVTLSRSVVRANCSWYVVDNDDKPYTGIKLTDVEIDMSRMTDRFNAMGVSGGGITATRVRWRGGADCFHYNSNVVIRNSLCEIPLWVKEVGGSPDPHMDGFHSAGGDNVLIDHNTIINANDSTSAIINGPDLRVYPPQTNVRIINNLMAGGGYTVYCNAHYARTSPTSEFRGNRISRALYPKGGQYGPDTDCERVPGYSTNVWDDTGSSIT